MSLCVKNLLGVCAAAGALLLSIAVGPSAASAWGPPPPPRPSAPSCGPTIYKASGGTWTCTFSDDFSGTRLDPTKWAALTSAATGLSAGSEQGCYEDNPNNISVSGGYLSLTVRKVAPFTCYLQSVPVTMDYTAGMVSTSGLFSQTYGRFEVRASFPAATTAGLQSSLWMWPQRPDPDPTAEIDIAEEYSLYADRVIPYVHYNYDLATYNTQTATNIPTNTNCAIADVSGFHQYTVVWQPGQIVFSYDGTTCLVDNYVSPLGGAAPFNQPFFLILTQALGIGANGLSPTSTPLPATTQIDYVRVWK